jgi:uncharacterized RDD family membrane protein YckC
MPLLIEAIIAHGRGRIANEPLLVENPDRESCDQNDTAPLRIAEPLSKPVNLPTQNYPPASLMRRFGAACYDSLPVGGLLFLTTLITVGIRGGASVPAGNGFFQLTLLAVVGAFFVFFWSRGGQTMGMRAWRVRVERQSGAALDWSISLARFAAALLSLLPLGLGFFWALIDPHKRTWHDRITNTRVVLLPRDAR